MLLISGGILREISTQLDGGAFAVPPSTTLHYPTMWTSLALLIVVARVTAGVAVATDQVRAFSDPAPKAGSGVSVPAVSLAEVPPDYTIGPEDRLSIVFWRDTELSGDVVVRPDGRISLPLLNDVQAAGLTPDELRARLLAAATEFIEDPAATVVVKEIHSRRVFITGEVDKPGAYPLAGPTTVLQLIATAGGLKEFVSGKNIIIMRSGTGRIKFNYQAVVSGKSLAQNIELRPGDTVIVP